MEDGEWKIENRRLNKWRKCNPRYSIIHFPSTIFYLPSRSSILDHLSSILYYQTVPIQCSTR